MKRLHIDISLTEEQDRELREKARDKGICKTDYARLKLFSEDVTEKDRKSILTLREFADRVHISISSARKLCREKRICFYRVGKVIRINEEEIEKFRTQEASYYGDDLSGSFFSTKQAANFLVVTRQTVVKWIKKGDLSARQVKGRYLIPKEELDRFVMQQKRIFL